MHGGGPWVWGPPVRRGKGGDDGGSFFERGPALSTPARMLEYILIRCDVWVVYSAFEPLSWHNGQ